MPDSDTIAAVSTPPGPGGVGMVRISGPDAIRLCRRIFTPAGGWKDFPPEQRLAFVGRAHQPDVQADPIDQAVVITFHKPRSYTGEDTVEITAHGGPLVLRALLEAAVVAGARLAEPGEFTRRAFLNGRMDLTQAEAVASLIFAATDEARKVMLRQVDGALSGAAGKIREKLKEAKILNESAIDFPEDVKKPESEHLRTLIFDSKILAQELISTAKEGIALAEGLSVAIAGTPNVGKSSLLNALLQEERAIVHEIPGTTRDFIEARVEIKGIPLKVVDTAGIREGASEVEVEGIFRTRKVMEKADLTMVVIDQSRKLGKGDRALIKETENTQRIIVANKTDLPSTNSEMPEGAVYISAKTGLGIEKLKDAVYETAFGKQKSSSGAVVTSVRQKMAFMGVIESCRRALEISSPEESPECLAVDIDEALMHMGELVGEVTTDEVLEEIFSRFCIGK